MTDSDQLVENENESRYWDIHTESNPGPTHGPTTGIETRANRQSTKSFQATRAPPIHIQDGVNAQAFKSQQHNQPVHNKRAGSQTK